MDEYGYSDESSVLYPDDPEPADADDQLGLDTDEDVGTTVPSGDDWNQVEFDPEAYLGHHPDDLAGHVLPIAGDNADTLWERFCEYADPETTPVVKDTWTWEHYKWEYYYEDDGSRPRDGDGEIIRHDEEEALGFDPDTVKGHLAAGNDAALELDDIVEERTVNIQEDIEEDEFFSTVAGNTTVSNRYDLEKAVPFEKKTHFREIERYWVNKPYAYVIIFHSEKENEKKYYMIEPYQNEIENELQEFLSGKLRTAIKYSEDGIKEKATEDGRRTVIEDETRRLLQRYDLFEATSGDTSEGILETLRGSSTTTKTRKKSTTDRVNSGDRGQARAGDPRGRSGHVKRVPGRKLLYLLKRDFIGYERIDGIKHDINVEDISVDGYNSPVFVYHPSTNRSSRIFTTARTNSTTSSSNSLSARGRGSVNGFHRSTRRCQTARVHSSRSARKCPLTGRITPSASSRTSPSPRSTSSTGIPSRSTKWRSSGSPSRTTRA